MNLLLELIAKLKTKHNQVLRSIFALRPIVLKDKMIGQKYTQFIVLAE